MNSATDYVKNMPTEILKLTNFTFATADDDQKIYNKFSKRLDQIELLLAQV